MPLTKKEFEEACETYDYPRLYARAKVTFEIYWCPVDFETAEEWNEFVEKMNSDRDYARKAFVSNVWDLIEDYGEDGATQIEDGKTPVELQYVEKEEDDVDSSR